MAQNFSVSHLWRRTLVAAGNWLYITMVSINLCTLFPLQMEEIHYPLNFLKPLTMDKSMGDIDLHKEPPQTQLVQSNDQILPAITNYSCMSVATSQMS